MRADVVLADRNPLYLAGLATAVHDCDNLELVGSARRSDETHALVVRRRPDVTVVGALLGYEHEHDLLKTIAGIGALSRVVCLISHLDGELAVEALAAGAHGCISTDADPNEVCEVLSASVRGELQLSPDIQDTLVRRLRQVPEPQAVPLTTREQEVLELAAVGLTAPQMASRLEVSVSTVKTHLHHVYAKLAVDGRAAAVAEGLRRGLVR